MEINYDSILFRKFVQSHPYFYQMKKLYFLFSLVIFTCFNLYGQMLKGGGEKYPDLHTNERALQKWQALRFGMFVHWGPVSLKGTEIGWSRGNPVPFEEYDNLYCDISGTSGYNALYRDQKQAAIFLQKHCHKILYGTDNTHFPLLELLHSMKLGKEQMEMILHRNATKVLG